jgi:hypothetical protein
LGGLLRWSSGAPLTLTAGGLSTIWQEATNTPHLVGELPEPRLTRHSDGRLPTYFPDLVPGDAGSDPGRAGVTGADSLSAAYNRRAIFDAQGNPVLVTPAPGEVGGLGFRTFDGPSRFELDINLFKRVRVDEERELELRVDVENILNHPNFGNPSTDINAPNFGQISSATDGRRFTIGARLNF